MHPLVAKYGKDVAEIIIREGKDWWIAERSNTWAERFRKWSYIAQAKAKAKQAKEGATVMEILFLVVVAVMGLLVITSCAGVRARMWAAGSDWADKLDGTDDVPSVVFETETNDGEPE